MKFDARYRTDPVLSDAVISLMCIKHPNPELVPEWTPKQYGGTSDLESVDIVTTINGVEVDFNSLVQKLYKQYQDACKIFDDYVQREAQKIAFEVIADSADKFGELMQRVIDERIIQNREQ